MKLSFTTIFFIVLFLKVSAQSGTPDYSFGDSGKVVSQNYQGLAYASLIQPDEKIVVAGGDGFYYKNNRPIHGSFLARYNSDGTIDLTFGDSGRAIYNLGDTSLTKIIYSIALQADGKIVAAGAAAGVNRSIAVMRFNADGSVDESFGNKGITITSLSQTDEPRDMALLSDGRIVVTGDVHNGVNDNNRSFIVCYTPYGVLDEDFGNKGSVIIQLQRAMDINAIVITPESNIIIGGNYTITFEDILLQYHDDGSIDNSFGINGLAELPFARNIADGNVKDIALTTDGKIVTAGFAEFNAGYDAIAVTRFLNNGTPDSSFGTNAYTTTKYDLGNAYANSLALQQNGKIIVSGYQLTGETSVFTTLRYTLDGWIDSSFATDGIENTFFYGQDESYSAVIQDDGKIVIAGNSLLPYPDYRSVTDIARYNNNDETKKQKIISKIKHWIHNHNLYWQNINENDVSYYTVERSHNASNGFVQIGRVSANRSNRVYNYTDNTAPYGTSYYRISAVSSNGGAVTSSDVVSDARTETASSITIAPNPVTNVLTIKGLSSINNYKLTITNESGNVVATTQVNNASLYKFNVCSLNKGVYNINIASADGTISPKFVKE